MPNISEYKTEYKALLEWINYLDDKLDRATEVYPINNFYNLYEEARDSRILDIMSVKKDGKIKQELQLLFMKDIAECFELSLKIIKKRKGAWSLERKIKTITDIYDTLKNWNDSEKISTTTEKALMAILDDEQAFDFWKALGTDPKTASFIKEICVKAFWDKLRATYSDQTFNDPSNKIHNITPYALRTVVDLCDGWDNFVEACKGTNPFESIICTKSRATLCNNSNDDMAPKDGEFYSDRATCGQAPFGSFFLLVKTHPDAEEEAEKWSVITTENGKVVLVHAPASKSLPDSWKMESQGRILSMNTRKYLAWTEESSNVTLENEDSKRIITWAIIDGSVYCNDDSGSTLTYCLCGSGKSVVKGSEKDANALEVTFVNYLPWIEGEDVEDDEDEEDEDDYDDDNEGDDDDDDDETDGL